MMKILKSIRHGFLILMIVSCPTHSYAKRTYGTPAGLSYYFMSPASNWNEAIPIGNGRLGAMIFGGVEHEKIQTNDDTFWSGEPRDYQKPETYKCLPEIRKLLFDGKNQEAEKLINKYMLGPNNESYMPMADILLNFDDSSRYTQYKRTLDLTKGIVTITYLQNGVHFKREIFASYPDQCIVIRLTSDKAKSINLAAEITSLVRHQATTRNSELIIDGIAPERVEPKYMGVHEPVYKDEHGTRFEGRLAITDHNGTVQTDGNKLYLKHASSATLVFVAATSFNGFDKDPYKDGKNEKKLCTQYLKQVYAKDFKSLYQRHTKDFASLFGRVDINFGTSPESFQPIDKRVKNYQAGKDPALTALYFQFGRYLLISSSRPGTEPPNLQGIWNNELQPAWSSNWTLNCNAEINYWPVEVANLSECHLPFMDMIREASVDGRKTAKNLYNCRGWMAHHNLDLWRTTWPVSGTGQWAIFQVGSAWMCQHIWTHYLYTQDKQFLKEYYPLLHDAALFYIDNLQKDKDGFLVTNPSNSFENCYILPNGERGWACVGSSQDMQIIRSLFQNTIKSAEILNVDSDFRVKMQQCCSLLPPLKISPRTHQLQEWNEDWDALKPHNGMIMQGWGLVEGYLFSLRRTPELAEAFRKTLEYRKPETAENSGSWTGAFAANYWARLENSNKVQEVFDRHFLKALYPNLTCQFHQSWQIDGNLGMTAAVANMLLQSQDGEINLLPALPDKYSMGYVKGLKAIGGYTIDISWQKGALGQVKIQSKRGGTIPVRYKNEVKTIKLKPNQSVILHGEHLK